MLEAIKYVNHLGEVIQFGQDGIFVNENDLRDYSWGFDSNRNRVENFRKGVVSKTIPVQIVAESDTSGTRLKNAIFEICEKDVIAERPGKLYIGEYYLSCYVVGSTKSLYLAHKNMLNTSMQIVTDKDWIRENKTSYVYRDNTVKAGTSDDSNVAWGYGVYNYEGEEVEAEVDDMGRTTKGYFYYNDYSFISYYYYEKAYEITADYMYLTISTAGNIMLHVYNGSWDLTASHGKPNGTWTTTNTTHTDTEGENGTSLYATNNSNLLSMYTNIPIFNESDKEAIEAYITEGVPQGDGKGYPYDYPYDYANASNNGKIYNQHFVPCNFLMQISGYALNPIITIGDHVYQVDATVQEGELLTIDSREQTITLTRSNGVVENLFSKRNKDSYIFEQIPSGSSDVQWNGAFSFSITLFEERSEPKWT